MHRTKVTFGMFLFIQRHVKQVIFGTPTLTIWNLDSSLSKWKGEHTDILGYIPTSPSSKDQSTCLNIKVCLNVNDTGALGATFSNTDWTPSGNPWWWRTFTLVSIFSAIHCVPAYIKLSKRWSIRGPSLRVSLLSISPTW